MAVFRVFYDVPVWVWQYVEGIYNVAVWVWQYVEGIYDVAVCRGNI